MNARTPMHNAAFAAFADAQSVIKPRGNE